MASVHLSCPWAPIFIWWCKFCRTPRLDVLSWAWLSCFSWVRPARGQRRSRGHVSGVSEGDRCLGVSPRLKPYPSESPLGGVLGAAILQMKGSFFLPRKWSRGWIYFFNAWIQSEWKSVPLCLGPGMALVTPRRGNGGRKVPASCSLLVFSAGGPCQGL